MKKIFIPCFLLLISSWLYSQGIIRGSVIEDATGEPLFGVTVVIKGTTTGIVTDFEGQFQLKTEPGTYEVQVSFVSFATMTISDVNVSQGQVTDLFEIRMKEELGQLEEVLITAEAVRSSESALLTVKRKAVNVIDGISAQTFKRIGDGDAAAAAKRVTGVSVEGGKYVYVRGLGDRYTKSMLNGMDIPGLDPDRNSLQMDIFPTNVVDNLTVLKSFTPDLPADFTGGVVNIETKDFPEEKVFDVSVGYSYNPDMHFNSDFRVYEGSKTDFLGFDNGRRDIPIDKNASIPNRVLGDPLTAELTNKFDKTLASKTESRLGNLSLGLTSGNQFSIGNNSLGYNVSLAYKNQSRFYEDIKVGLYQKADLTDQDIFTQRVDKFASGDQGQVESQLSGLFGVAYKTKSTKIKLNYLHILNGLSTATYYGSTLAAIDASWSGERTVLEYNERSIQNILLSGDHKLADKWDIKWKVSPTISRVEDKDIRTTPYRKDENDPTNLSIEPSETGDPNRLWRNLEETNFATRLDFVRQFVFLAGESKLKFGTGYVFKQRDFEIINYTLNIQDDGSLNITGDPDQLLSDGFRWTPETDLGSWHQGGLQPSNAFEASQTNLSAYVSGELQLLSKLKSIAGVRMEQYIQNYKGIDQFDIEFDDEVINSTKFFPSLNFIYELMEKSNLRLSYARTIARPSFKEASFAQIIDPVVDRTFVGSLRKVNIGGEEVWDGNVKETDIDNFDLRFETYLPEGQTFSVSLFYKSFKNPLELVVLRDGNIDNFQVRNLGDANVVGIELEGRKNLSFLSPSLKNLFLNANVSFMNSSLEMDKSAAGEFQSRVANAREGEEIEDTREMQGQAPYIINAGLSYEHQDRGLDAGLYFNQQGKTLSVTGIGAVSDVYSQPFSSLNFSLSKKLGREFNSTVQLRVSNLLDDDRERFYESFRADDEIFDVRSPGRAISVSYSYSF